jgi:(2Fe-2S) ferredoxin
MVVYPEGVWYGNLTESDIDTIVEEHFEGGKPVKALRI